MTVSRAILLDALGTLVELEPPWPLLRRELAGRGVEVSDAEARGALLAEMTYYREHCHGARDAAALDDLRDRCTAVLAAALPPAARELPDLREALLASIRFSAYPEAAGVLEELRARGAALAVVSNWDVSLHAVLAQTGLAPLVDHVLTSAEAGASKPDPAIFAAALGTLGAQPHEALHVGDDAAADVGGARAAGIEPVLVARDGARGPAGVRVIRSLRELVERNT